MRNTSTKIPEDEIKRVFNKFRDNYKNIPLETFRSDPYQTLISTLLSSRTKDETTLTASKRLFKTAPNIYKLKELNKTKIEKLIFPVGFYKTKAKHLKKLAEIIINKYQGRIPSIREDLVSLPGVGRKTANLVLNRAFKKPAIAVDTHVHRISNLLNWVKTKTPEQTEKQLIKILPKKYWKEINHLFVSIGRQFPSKTKLKEFLQTNKLIHQ